MARGALLLALCVLGLSCSDEAATGPDLATVLPDLAVGDLAVADLAAPIYLFDMAHCAPLSPVDGFASSADAAGFCDGTTLAGTCAQPFFAAYASCYVPAGCRQYFRVNNGRASWEFASGASINWDASGIRDYRQNDDQCALASTSGSVSGDDHWTLGDGTTLTINWTSGNVTCPDGSQIQLANPKSCDALNTLMAVPPLGSDPSCCLP